MLKRLKLIEGYAAASWKLYSVRLLALATAVATYAALNPDQAAAVVAYVPEQWRPAVTIAGGFVVWWMRGARQE